MSGQLPERQIHPFPWKTVIWAATIVVVMGMVLVVLQRLGNKPFDSAEKMAAVAQQTMTNLPAIAEKFFTGQITTTFQASIPEVDGTEGDVLELAVIESDEIFRREDSRRVLWDRLNLGTTVAEIRVPVTYRYHLRLSDPWQLASRDRVCLVLAPPIRPSLPPAIHTDEMTKSTTRGWARLNEDESLAELEQGMTPTLEERAMEPSRLAMVREESRRSVAAFVRRWLMEEDHWRHDRFSAIVVVFPDEEAFAADSELETLDQRPTIELQMPPSSW